mgnify:CR=1 FL=1
MSHFSVAVFTDGTKTVDELLAPYDESIVAEEYIDMTREDIIKHAKEQAKKIISKINSGKEPTEQEKAYLKANTDEEFYRLGFDPYGTYDDTGNLLSTYNPKSNGDWYDIGGRWHGYCLAYGIDPNGMRVSELLKIKDDIMLGQSAYRNAIRFWELYVEGEEPATDDDKRLVNFVLYSKEYYLNRYKDKETYAGLQAQFSTFAVVLPDGSWHEPGQMGWFGCSSASDEEAIDWEKNYIERFICGADPNWTMTVVDCHI